MAKFELARAIVPSFSKVEDVCERSVHWNAFLALWYGPRHKVTARERSFFPGCNPWSLSRSTAATMGTHEYAIALKSDGVRYALFLTMRPGVERSPVALMIDRSKNMYEVELVAGEEYFSRGTIFEGELVWRQPDETALMYLVFDAIVVAGDRLTTAPFRERIARATACTTHSDDLAALPDEEMVERADETNTIVMLHYHPHITMRPKHFVDREHASRLWRDRFDADHRSDGIVLNRLDAPYPRGAETGGVVLKWKEDSTVDLCGHPPAPSDAPLPEIVGGRRVVVLASRIEPNGPDDVIEYLVSLRGDKEVTLFAVRRRPDKNVANTRRVVEATVNDVVEAIGPDELERPPNEAINEN